MELTIRLTHKQANDLLDLMRQGVKSLMDTNADIAVDIYTDIRNVIVEAAKPKEQETAPIEE